MLKLADAVANVRSADRAKGRDPPRKHDAYGLHVIPQFGASKRLADIDAPAIRDYMLKRHRERDGRANLPRPATINRELVAIPRLFTQAIKDGKIPAGARPHIELDKGEKQNVRIGFFEDHEHEALLATPTMTSAPHVRDCVIAHRETGWRTSDVKALRWRHVDFERGIVKLDAAASSTKKKPGAVAMTPELRATLERRWAARVERRLRATRRRVVPMKQDDWRNERVFMNKTGSRPVGGFVKRWEKALKEAIYADPATSKERKGIPDRVKVLPDGAVEHQRAHLHDYRRTVARDLERAPAWRARSRVGCSGTRPTASSAATRASGTRRTTRSRRRAASRNTGGGREPNDRKLVYRKGYRELRLFRERQFC